MKNIEEGLRRERGATLLESVIVVALITLGGLAAITQIGADTKTRIEPLCVALGGETQGIMTPTTGVADTTSPPTGGKPLLPKLDPCSDPFPDSNKPHSG